MSHRLLLKSLTSYVPHHLERSQDSGLRRGIILYASLHIHEPSSVRALLWSHLGWVPPLWAKHRWGTAADE
jgi:hypothetical protein